MDKNKKLKKSVLVFCLLNHLESDKDMKNLLHLQNLCSKYKRIIEFFESDPFSVSILFLMLY